LRKNGKAIIETRYANDDDDDDDPIFQVYDPCSNVSFISKVPQDTLSSDFIKKYQTMNDRYLLARNDRKTYIADKDEYLTIIDNDNFREHMYMSPITVPLSIPGVQDDGVTQSFTTIFCVESNHPEYYNVLEFRKNCEAIIETQYANNDDVDSILQVYDPFSGCVTDIRLPWSGCNDFEYVSVSIKNLIVQITSLISQQGYALRVRFTSIRCDSYLFIYQHGIEVTYLLIYVDDIVLTASSTALLQCIISSLQNEFDMIDLGALNYFLRISVTRDARGMFLSRKKYAMELLERIHMSNYNATRTPVDTKSKLGSDGDPICLHMHDPREPHLASLKWVLCHVRDTLDFKLQLYASPTSSLVAYTNVDWAGCPTTRGSTLGYCVFFGDNLFSWSSKRQHELSHSSAKAEYRGVANLVVVVLVAALALEFVLGFALLKSGLSQLDLQSAPLAPLHLDPLTPPPLDTLAPPDPPNPVLIDPLAPPDLPAPPPPLPLDPMPPHLVPLVVCSLNNFRVNLP
nr:ribonuclease H-like domain-containing protein [Tanacetum cinerariifolium]